MGNELFRPNLDIFFAQRLIKVFESCGSVLLCLHCSHCIKSTLVLHILTEIRLVQVEVDYLVITLRL